MNVNWYIKNKHWLAIGEILVIALLMLLVIENGSASYKNIVYNDLSDKSRSYLNELKKNTSESYVLQSVLNEMFSMICEEKTSVAALDKKIEEFSSKGFTFINIRFFDKNSNRLGLKNIKNDTTSSAFQRLYASLTQYYYKHDDTNLKRYRSLFETLLGAIDVKDLAMSPSHLVSVNIGGQSGYLYWNIFENAAVQSDLDGMIAWVRKSDIPEDFFYHRAIDILNSKAMESLTDEIMCGTIDSSDPEKIYPAVLPVIPGMPAPSETAIFGGKIDNKNLLEKINELKSDFEDVGTFDGNVLAFSEIGENRLFVMIRDSSFSIDLVLALLRTLIVATAGYCIVKFATTSDFKDVFSHYWGISLFGTAIVLFLIVFGLVINISGSENDKDFAYRRLARILQLVDDGFEEAKVILKDRWINLSSDIAFKSLDKESMDARASDMFSVKLLTRAYVADENGDILWAYPNQALEGTFKKIMPVISRKIATDRFSTEQNWKNRIEDVLVGNITSSFSDILGDDAANILRPFENYDIISELNLGSNRSFVYSTLIKSKEEDKRYIFIAWLDAKPFAEDYLLGRIKEVEAMPENHKNFQLGMVSAQMDKSPYPSEIAKFSFSREMTERIVITGRSQHFEARRGTEKCFVVGERLRNVPSYILYALQPAED